MLQSFSLDKYALSRLYPKSAPKRAKKWVRWNKLLILGDGSFTGCLTYNMT